jgi:hypothetical protein
MPAMIDWKQQAGCGPTGFRICRLRWEFGRISKEITHSPDEREYRLQKSWQLPKLSAITMS